MGRPKLHYVFNDILSNNKGRHYLEAIDSEVIEALQYRPSVCNMTAKELCKQLLLLYNELYKYDGKEDEY